MADTPVPGAQPAGAAPTPLQQGRWFESQGRFHEAVASYARARAELTEGVPPESVDRRALSIVCMNRASALRQIGDEASLHASLAAYDEAIALQRSLPVSEDPLVMNTLGAALMNRSQLLHRIFGPNKAEEALQANREAEALLRLLAASTDHPAPLRNLTGTLVNRTHLYLHLGQFAPAAADAREALSLAAPAERTDPGAAGLSLLARRSLCDALGQLLGEPGNDPVAITTEASDAVDEGLAVARHWFAQGERAFDPLAAHLFLFGARLYCTRQPQFLAEFLLEHLEVCPDPQLIGIAREALTAALNNLQGPEPAIAGAPTSDKTLETARTLRAALAQLTPSSPPPPGASAIA